MYCDTIDEIVIGLTPFTVYSLITTVNNTAEKRANLPSHIMKTTLLLQTPTPTQQDISKMAVSVKTYQFNGHFKRKKFAMNSWHSHWKYTFLKVKFEFLFYFFFGGV